MTTIAEMASKELNEKSFKSPQVSTDVEVQQGGFEEIQPEFDLSEQEKEQNDFDYDSEHSPFPEGMRPFTYTLTHLMGDTPSTRRRP